MVSSVTLGNFFNINGKEVSGGVGGSGLDTEALIKALTEAKSLPATKLQDQITLNDKKVAALSDFKTLLSKLQDAANFLRSPPGVGNAGDNVFKFTTASVTSNTSTAGSTYLSVSAAAGATVQSYTIDEISSLAAAKKQATGDINIATADSAAVSDTPAAGQFKSGTFTLNGQSITFAAGDSLNAVAAKFNAVKGLTGIAATVIKVEDGKFNLSFSATQSGTANDFDFNNVDVPGTLVDAGGVFGSVTITDSQDVSDAVFTIDGVEVTRSTNSINDVVDGVTFNLLQTTPALTELTVDVKPDEQIVKNGIINFINAYNDLKTFAAKQTELKPDGTFADTALLAGSSSMRTTVNAVNSQLASIISGITGGNPSRLSEIGISFVDLPASKDNPKVPNVLNLDDGKLASAISTNFDGVRKLFEFDLTSDNPNLSVFSRTNALGVSNFTLTINPGTATYQATYNLGAGPVTIDLDSSTISGGTGILLKGQAGTVLEGLQLIYASASSATISVTATQGVADKIYNTTTNTLTPDTGSLAIEQNIFKTSDAKLTTEIARINDQVDRFRQQLLDKFGALEQVISRVNTLLQSLTAQQDAKNNG